MKKKALQGLTCFFLLLFIFSLANMVKWYLDSKKTEKQLETIYKHVSVKEIKDSETTEIIDQANPYWDYIRMNLIEVDFQKLKKINSSTIGWIQVAGTNINYPFVQHTDNSYYLTHAYNKSKNNAGWVFLDYRNQMKALDKNTIIYAHGRVDETMFGSLKKTLTNSWRKDPANFVVKMSTETENTLWQVFSVYKIPTTSDYLQIHFSDSSFEKFAQKLSQRSEYSFNTPVNKNDHILTLSTCYNDNEKVVLHAKLIKRSQRVNRK